MAYTGRPYGQARYGAALYGTWAPQDAAMRINATSAARMRVILLLYNMAVRAEAQSQARMDGRLLWDREEPCAPAWGAVPLCCTEEAATAAPGGTALPPQPQGAALAMFPASPAVLAPQTEELTDA